MKLEEEIKQKKFRSEQQKGVINIIYTANWLNAMHGSHLKKFDLTPEQFNILRILRGQYPKPATVNLLIERMLNKMSNASRLVDKLLAKKLVVRSTCKEDRRAVDVVITKKGLDLLAELDDSEKDWVKDIHPLSPQEAKTLNDLLDKLRG
jgi:DNA-binding MarR family transcriptional regulator